MCFLNGKTITSYTNECIKMTFTYRGRFLGVYAHYEADGDVAGKKKKKKSSYLVFSDSPLMV